MNATGIADWVGRQPSDPSPIIYFSGIPRSAQAEEEDFLRLGCKNRCLSYAYVGEDTGLYSQANRDALDFCMSHGVNVFLDSGAHTLQNLAYGKKKFSGVARTAARSEVEKLVQKWMQAYSAFVKQYQKKQGRFAFYVNCDWVHECHTIYKVLADLYRLGIRPIPVYHGDAGMDWLDRYADDGHRLIGVSWSNATKGGAKRRQYYGRVFNWAEKRGIAIHGFAQTGRAMFDWPWYSVDSSSWLKVAAYGSIIDTMPGSNGRLRLRVLHVSSVFAGNGKGNPFALNNLPKAVIKDLRDRVEKKGFDLDVLQTSLCQRGLYNVRTFLDISQNYSLRKETSWEQLL